MDRRAGEEVEVGEGTHRAVYLDVTLECNAVNDNMQQGRGVEEGESGVVFFVFLWN